MTDAADTAPRLIGIDTLRVHHDQIDRLRRRELDNLPNLMPDDDLPLDRQPGRFELPRHRCEPFANRFFQLGVEAAEFVLRFISRLDGSMTYSSVVRA